MNRHGPTFKLPLAPLKTERAFERRICFGDKEALAKQSEQGKVLPKPMVVPHETPLLGMAYGCYLATGRPQFTMVHDGVGTANGLGMLMAATRAQVSKRKDARPCST